MVLYMTMPVHAQLEQTMLPPEQRTGGFITGGLGTTIIDGNTYFLFHLRPEMAFGPLGVGLDLNLRFDRDGNFYREDFNDTYDYFRIIRYLRWNQKGDSFYTRAGALDYATLGYGSVMYLYQNSPSYENRKIGLELDMDFGHFGYESVFSDLGFQQGGGVFGLRGYIRPLPLFWDLDIPVISRLEIGATYSADIHDYAGIVDQEPYVPDFPTTPIHRWDNRIDEGSMQIVGFDIGLPWLSLPMVRSTIYTDYANILGFGQGVAFGTDFRFLGLGILNIFSKLEYRISSDRFIHSYFNTSYEIERYRSSFPDWSSRANELDNVVSPGPGYFGALTLDFLGFLQITGNYQRLIDDPNSGRLFLRTNTGDMMPGIYMDVGYDKRNISDESGIFTLDENSLLFANVGYKPYPFLLVSVLYQWTWTPVTDPVTGDRSYQTQERVEPRVSFIFTF